MTTTTRIAKALTLSKQTLATAESCTGGLLSHTLTNIPGSSSFFRGGIIAYAYEAKTKFLGVPQTMLKKHGAVSFPVVRAMAKGARKRFGTDFSVSLTGIAGPTGGTKTKPVGLVFIAAASAEKTIIKRCFFKGTRLQIKTQAAKAALHLIGKLIKI